MDLRKLQRLLKGMAGGSRLMILSAIRKRRMASVGEIAAAVRRSHNTVSHHLSTLEKLRIVVRRRRGRNVFYRFAIPQERIVKEVLREL